MLRLTENNKKYIFIGITLLLLIVFLFPKSQKKPKKECCGGDLELKALNNVYNVAVGDRTSLNQLYKTLVELIKKKNKFTHSKLIYRDFRDGDVRHSQADISKAKKLLGFTPIYKVRKGLKETVEWHFSKK